MIAMKMMSNFPRLVSVGVLLIAVGFLSGCAIGSGQGRALAVKPTLTNPESKNKDWLRQAGKYQVEMRIDPDKPKAGEEVTIEFLIWDVTQDPVARVSGASMTCKPSMPKTPWHYHIRSDHLHHPEIEPGSYRMPSIKFDMGGQWDILLQAKAPDGYEFDSTFSVWVEDSRWPVEYVDPKDRKAPDKQWNIIRGNR